MIQVFKLSNGDQLTEQVHVTAVAHDSLHAECQGPTLQQGGAFCSWRILGGLRR